MIYKFNETKLQRGDILLTTTSGKISKFVRCATQSDVSHVMFYASDYSALDSTLEGVHARNTQRIYFDQNCAAYVLRLKGGLTEEKRAYIEYLIRLKIGTTYTMKEAVLTSVGGNKRWSKRQFCSRLIAQAFHDSGIKLVVDPNFCTPEDIKNSALLENIEGAIMEVDTIIEERPDAGELMRKSTNYILSRARKVNKDIQDFNDLYKHLVTNPGDDDQFNGWYVESGYLDVWKIDRTNNLWQYDIQAFYQFEMSLADKKKYCLWARVDGEKGMEFYLNEMAKTKVWMARHPLKVFKTLELLNEKLINLHYERIAVANEWLAKNNK